MKKKFLCIILSILLLASFPSAAFAASAETEKPAMTEETAETEVETASMPVETETAEPAAAPEETEAAGLAAVPVETETAEPDAMPVETEAAKLTAVPEETEAEEPTEVPEETEAAEPGPVTITITKSVITNDYSGDATVPITNALKEADQNASSDSPYTIKVEAGSYQLRYALRLCSFTTLDLTGVTLTQTSSDQNMLRVGSYQDIEEVGYCYQDMTLIGGTFDQKNNTTVAVKGAHAKNLTIKNVTVKNTYNAHLMEYAGVKGLTISGCTLENQKIDNTHLYYEAIQLDILVPEHYNNYAYEALPNSSILVENCRFKNVPRGFGSHTAILNEPVNGVTIKDCTFTNCESAAIQGLQLESCYHYRKHNHRLHQSHRPVLDSEKRKSYFPALLFFQNRFRQRQRHIHCLK